MALVEAGFPAPEGLLVTTETFDRYAAADGPLRDSLSTLATAAAELGDQPLAVRSSSSVRTWMMPRSPVCTRRCSAFAG